MNGTITSEKNSHFSANTESEMDEFTKMAEKSLHEMLGHPLSKTFLEMKWELIKPKFVPIFVLYFLFAIMHTGFSYFVTDMKEHTWKYEIEKNETLTIDPDKIFEVGPEKPGRKL